LVCVLFTYKIVHYHKSHYSIHDENTKSMKYAQTYQQFHFIFFNIGVNYWFVVKRRTCIVLYNYVICFSIAL